MSNRNQLQIAIVIAGCIALVLLMPAAGYGTEPKRYRCDYVQVNPDGSVDVLWYAHPAYQPTRKTIELYGLPKLSEDMQSFTTYLYLYKLSHLFEDAQSIQAELDPVSPQYAGRERISAWVFVTNKEGSEELVPVRMLESGYVELDSQCSARQYSDELAAAAASADEITPEASDEFQGMCRLLSSRKVRSEDFKADISPLYSARYLRLTANGDIVVDIRAGGFITPVIWKLRPIGVT